MKVWDMHCDTLAELRYAQQAGKPKSFLHNDLMMDLERICSPETGTGKKPPAGLPGRNRHFLPPAGTVSR